MLIEPTESESLQTLDAFIATMRNWQRTQRRAMRAVHFGPTPRRWPGLMKPAPPASPG